MHYVDPQVSSHKVLSTEQNLKCIYCMSWIVRSVHYITFPTTSIVKAYDKMNVIDIDIDIGNDNNNNNELMKE